MTHRRSLLLAGGALALSVPWPGRPARAQRATGNWPRERPIEVVVPFPPGGGVDIMVRALLPFLQGRLPGANFVVLNRGGAGGQVGNEATAAAAADGYNLGAVSLPGFISVPIERTVRYRPTEMTLLANVVDDPCGLFVRTASPLRSMADAVAAAKAAPDTISYGTSGIGSDDHIAVLGLEQRTGTTFTHVPFTGMSQLFPQLLSGQVEIGAMNVSEALPLVVQGGLRGLGQASEARWPAMADLPTYREQGIDLVASASRGFVAPGRLPAPVREALENAFRAVLADPAFLREAERLAMPVRALVGEDYREHVLAQEAEMRRLWSQRPWRDQ